MAKLVLHLTQGQTLAGAVESAMARATGLALKHLAAYRPGDEQADEHVHQARVAVKRIRALWRLVRPTFGERVYSEHNAALRKAVSLLSPARDEAVMRQALQDLAGELREHDGLRDAVQRVIEQLPSNGPAPVEPSSIERLTSVLRDSCDAFPRAIADRGGWAIVGPGFQRLIRQAQTRATRAWRTESAEDLHDLRKRVKDLQYNLGLFLEVWPALGKRVSRLTKLTQLLGEDHDLWLIERRLGPTMDPHVKHLVWRRQRTLRRRAHRLCRTVRELASASFQHRLKARWRAARRRLAEAPKPPGRNG